LTIRLFHKILLVFLLIVIIDAGIPFALALQSQAISSPREFELTEDFVRSIESLLANPTTNRKLEIYDRLVFGKGRFLLIDGQSRKYVVLALDAQGKYLVRLFDLASMEDHERSWKGVKHYTGVCSKAEVTREGIVEITLIYASLAESAEKNYSPAALDSVNRTESSERRNQQKTSQSQPPVPSVPQSPTAQRDPEHQTPHSTPPRTSPSSPVKESSEEIDTDLPSGDRPVLRRRLPGEAEKHSRSQSAGALTHSASMDHPQSEKDVVVYRRKDTVKPETAADTIVQGGSEEAALVDSSPAKPKFVSKEADGLLLIPEGYITLGSDETGDPEKPLNRVLVQSFYIDKFEVTNEDYQMFCTATGHRPPLYWKGNHCPPGLEKHPVAQVTWLDAMAYARWTGKRLPTEVEWERAAKGPNSTRYAYGNAYDPKKANTEQGKTMAVGSYRPNEFGLYDMTGNVNEWTSSLYAAYPYRKDDGREDPKADGPRVLRGGTYAVDGRKARCLVRLEADPTQTAPSTGFRCARDAQ
jgi:formylglycine-generating enzyme required for sulfatase activity